MSDDERPDNVYSLPRIGSLPPPATPPAPALAPPAAEPGPAAEPVRISPFDAPPVPVAPRAPDLAPAAFGSDPAPDAGPPRTGALSMAAILAIALAAFEGLRTWIQESGPRRAENAAHRRELELLAAKANADAAKYAAQTDCQRAKALRGNGVQPSHEYGRKALGRAWGGSGRHGGPNGPAGYGKGPRGPYGRGVGGLRHDAGHLKGPKGPLGQPRGARSGHGSPGHPGGAGKKPRGSADGAVGSRGAGAARGGKRPGAANGKTGAAPSPRTPKQGRATLPQAARKGAEERWNHRRPTQPVLAKTDQPKKSKAKDNGPKTKDSGPKMKDSGARAKGGKTTSGGTGGGKPQPTGAKSGRTTLPQATRQAIEDRWKRRKSPTPVLTKTDKPKTPKDSPPDPNRAKSPRKDRAKPDGPGPDKTNKPKTNEKTSAPDDDRTTFWQAVGERAEERWKKRRDKAGDPVSGPRKGPRKPKPKAKKSRGKHGPQNEQEPSEATPGADTGPGGEGDDSGFAWEPRTSPWDDEDATEPVTITVERADAGPGSQARRWEPAPVETGRRGLPRTGPPALPRAPQRPAGQRPGTTHRKDPIPMPKAQVTVPQGGLPAQHATEVTLDDVLKALEELTTQGLETHDECAALAKGADRLLGALEDMAEDLSQAHNVTGQRTANALTALRDTVADLLNQAERTARAALDAAELSEAEETAMNRDHRPVADATADAGLLVPSARVHNEN